MKRLDTFWALSTSNDLFQVCFQRVHTDLRDLKWIMFCALDMHRRNINRAISDNMLEELGKLSSVVLQHHLANTVCVQA